MACSDEDTAVTDVTHPVAHVGTQDCLVVVYPLDSGAGRRIELSHAPIRIGRDADNELVLEDENVSRRHARLERRGQRLVLMDVGSTNGTLLNDRELMEVAELRTGDRIKVGSTIFKYLSASDLEAALHEQIYLNTITDELTQLRNKRYFNEELAREVSRSRRHGRPLSLVIVDIDHFKRVNDSHGHPVGDVVLKEVADAVRTAVRDEDVVARFGGEELVVLLPETTLEQATTLAEKLRDQIAALVIEYRDVQVRVTASLGCAQFEAEDPDADAFLDRCDRCLYAAKAAGRNCVKW